DRRIVPLSGRFAAVRAVLRKGSLNFRDAVGGRSLLPALLTAFCSFFCTAFRAAAFVRAARHGLWRGFLFCRRSLRSAGGNTQPCRQRQQQGRDDYFSADHCHWLSVFGLTSSV